MLLGRNINGLYYLQSTKTVTEAAQTEALISEQNVAVAQIKEVKVWHLRLGHMPIKKLKLLFPHFNTEKVANKYICTIWPLAKQTRLTFNKSSIQTNEAFQLIHVDI